VLATYWYLVMASHSRSDSSLLQQRTQRPSPLLLRTPVVVGSQQAVATGTRSQAAVTLQVLSSISTQSAKAVEEVGYFIASFPGFRLGKSLLYLLLTVFGFFFLSTMQATGYSYKVKIINPVKKSDAVVRQLHRFKSKFDSLTALRVKLIDEFAETVPDTVNFNVGYFDGRQQAKLWLVTNEDLACMYSKYRTGEITLWCDGRQSDRDRIGEEVRSKRKRDSEANVSRRQEREEEVDTVFKDLKEIHGSKFDTPRLRLWSRMICSNLHEDLENPPDIPAFSGSVPKKP